MKTVLLVFGLLLTASSFADTGSNSGADFQVDKNLFNQLYEESLKQNKVDETSLSSGMRLSVSGSLLSVSELTLSNNYFEVPYASGIGSLPSLQVAAAIPVTQFGRFSVSGLVSVGYSYKEGVQKAYSKTATVNTERTTLITVHRLPLAVGANLDYSISGLRQIRPFAVAKVGAEWFYQTGALDGLEQGFWIPYVELGGGLTLFEGAPQDWFRGISLSVSSHNGLGGSQIVRALAFDLGINILL